MHTSSAYAPGKPTLCIGTRRQHMRSTLEGSSFLHAWLLLQVQDYISMLGRVCERWLFPLLACSACLCHSCTSPAVVCGVVCCGSCLCAHSCLLPRTMHGRGFVSPQILLGCAVLHTVLSCSQLTAWIRSALLCPCVVPCACVLRPVSTSCFQVQPPRWFSVHACVGWWCESTRSSGQHF